MVEASSLSAFIERTRQAVQAAASDLETLTRGKADLEKKLAGIGQRIAVAQAIHEERASILRELEAACSTHAEAAGSASPRGARGRTMSEEWRNYLGNLPVAPDPPVPVRTVYDIVRRYDPAMPDKNIRSQLNAYKIKGIVELVNGGWRLTRPLQASGEIQSENEAGDGDVTVISDDETPPAEPSGVSGASSPLLSFQTRAAA